jgi:D-sedoheptulose 7-phosphate isomerase
MCDAMHFAEELSGRFKNDRPPLAALAISDPAYLSCTANDYGYEQVFARQVQAFGQAGDVLLAISTSGNSPNVLKAVSAAQAHKMTVIALTGKEGGQLKDCSEISLVVPSFFTSHIQETHIQLIHLFIEGIEQCLFPANN